MFRFLLFTLGNLFCLSTFSQTALFQQNIGITLAKGSILYIGGNYTTNTPVNNDGTVVITGNLTNNSTSGIFENGTGQVILTGASDQSLHSISSWQFKHLQLSKVSGEVSANCPLQIDSLLTFDGGNLYLNEFDLNLNMSGSLYGENKDSRIYSTTGLVKAKRSLSLPYDTSNIAGIGIYIHAPTEVFGTTEFSRGHYSIPEAGEGSIARWIDIKPSLSAPVESLSMSYFDNDGIIDEAFLQTYSRRSGATMYFPNGGNVDINQNHVISTLFRFLVEERITLAPQSDNSTCDPSNPSYVKSVFLSPTLVETGDTVYFVNLSIPEPDSVNSIWNTGDGFSFSLEDILHSYINKGTYNASLSVSNNVCSDASRKVVIVKDNLNRDASNSIVSELINSFIYYPNPVETSLNWYIDLTQIYPSSITLMDVFGRKVFEKHYQQILIQDQNDFSSLPQGLYLLTLEVMGRRYTYRIVKL